MNLCIEYISLSLSCNQDFTDLLLNQLPLSIFEYIFLYFKETTHSYLLEVSTTHN